MNEKTMKMISKIASIVLLVCGVLTFLFFITSCVSSVKTLRDIGLYMNGYSKFFYYIVPLLGDILFAVAFAGAGVISFMKMKGLVPVIPGGVLALYRLGYGLLFVISLIVNHGLGNAFFTISSAIVGILETLVFILIAVLAALLWKKADKIKSLFCFIPAVVAIIEFAVKILRSIIGMFMGSRFMIGQAFNSFVILIAIIAWCACFFIQKKADEDAITLE